MKTINSLLFAVSVFAPLGYSSASAAEIELTQGDATIPSFISITGQIETGDADRFSDVAQHTQRSVVFLNSPGGLVDEGLSIAAEIGQRGFTTVVAPGAHCHSICAVIWVSGASRMMDSTSEIGVHAAYRNQALSDGTSLTSESGVANADIGSFLTHVGLSREAIRYFTTAGPNDVLPITPEIAQRLDIDTSVTIGDRIVTPAERPTPRRLAWQSVTFIGLGSSCVSLFGLDAAFLQHQGGERLRLGHELFGGELFANLVPEIGNRVISDKESMALKDWCAGAATELHDQGMSVGISGPGYDCSKATTDTERAICGSFDLWLEDRALSSIYTLLRNAGTRDERASLAQKQRSWIGRRDSCRSDVDCISDRYRAWFLDLSLIAQNGI